MRKKIFLGVILFFLIATMKVSFTSHECKDSAYALQHYMTNNIFNKYKLYHIDSFSLNYSDSTICVFTVNGITKKEPRKRISCNVFLEKNSKGIWKVQRVYENLGTTNIKN